mgnify:CR=1 FL=1
MIEEVILVNTNNEVQGYMEKMEAHKKGLLHRAFSIFIFNSKGEILLQQRAKHKYHSGELWTNTCCSHPRKNESFLEAANRRLNEEMGLFCQLDEVFSFIYKADLDNGLIEHEFDFVFFGKTNALPILNIDEAMDYKYIKPEQLLLDIQNNPESFTEWLKISFNQVYKLISK